MFKIIEKKDLNNESSCITIEAKLIAQDASAGQFVSIFTDDNKGRIPLRLIDWDKEEGSITLVFSKLDPFFNKLAKLKTGDIIEQINGPLGRPTEVSKVGEIYCIAAGLGVAGIYPQARAFRRAGNRVVAIIEAEDADLLIFEDKMREVSDELFVAINDSKTAKNSSCAILKDLFGVIEKSTHTHFPDLAYCCGSIEMMENVAELTAASQVNTIVSLDPILVDAQDLCGGCRCLSKGNAIFDYSNGPDFAAEKINFKELRTQLGFIKEYKKELKA